MKKTVLAALAASALICVNANASVIDFEGIPVDAISIKHNGEVPDENRPIDGYSFNHKINYNFVPEDSWVQSIVMRLYESSSDDGYLPFNGGELLLVRWGELSVTAPARAVFSLNSFDLAAVRSGSEYPDSAEIKIIGTTLDGNSFTQKITIDLTPPSEKQTGNDLTHYEFTGFENIYRLDIMFDPASESFFDRFAIDNIDVTTTYVTPLPISEPSTYAMLLTGLGLMGFAISRPASNSRFNA
ncbi:MAG: hypothetical protein LZF61_05885 [Nitrosomonas sp.]|nr:MAG: hypothetical protein LZF61_05885 [Nitrosomonas sp.]